MNGGGQGRPGPTFVLLEIYALIIRIQSHWIQSLTRTISLELFFAVILGSVQKQGLVMTNKGPSAATRKPSAAARRLGAAAPYSLTMRGGGTPVLWFQQNRPSFKSLLIHN